MISRSVAQIATASIRTRTSARLGTGTGFSVSFNSPGLPRTHAFILSGTWKSGLVFTPGPEYIRVSSIPLWGHCSRLAAVYREFRRRAKRLIKQARRPRHGPNRQKHHRLAARLYRYAAPPGMAAI